MDPPIPAVRSEIPTGVASVLEEILIPAGVRSRPLDKELRAAADTRGSEPAIYEKPLDEARRLFIASRVLVDTSADGIGTQDQTIAGPAGPIPIRVYRPEGVAASAPIVLYLHGGGFVIGNLDTHDVVCRSYCRAAGAVVVSADYRLAPEHPYPAAADDAFAAFRFVAANAASLGGDPARIVVGGDSAGGNLAVVAALRARDEGGPAPAALIPFYPVTDLADLGRNASYRAYGDGSAGLSARDMEWFTEQYCPPPRRREAYASPIAAASLRGLPPTLVVLAEHDVLHDEGRDLAVRLAADGVPTTLLEVSGVNHGFLSAAPEMEETKAVYRHIGDWLAVRAFRAAA
jgi:acetyl esterase